MLFEEARGYEMKRKNQYKKEKKSSGITIQKEKQHNRKRKDSTFSFTRKFTR